jgi:preprotein translocase subunit SecD
MSFYAFRFNLILLPILAVSALLAGGCKTTKDKDDHVSSMRIHLETRAQMPGTAANQVSVLRTSPVLVSINPEPILTEANIIAATVLKTPDHGYAIEVKFDETGALILEQYSAANIGRHFVIFSQWSEDAKDSRWLAAPIISHRISNGILSFTPDASLEESQKIAVGLNNMAKKVAKGKMK